MGRSVLVVAALASTAFATQVGTASARQDDGKLHCLPEPDGRVYCYDLTGSGGGGYVGGGGGGSGGGSGGSGGGGVAGGGTGGGGSAGKPQSGPKPNTGPKPDGGTPPDGGSSCMSLPLGGGWVHVTCASKGKWWGSTNIYVGKPKGKSNPDGGAEAQEGAEP